MPETAPTSLPEARLRLFQPKALSITAVQYTGPDSVKAVQEFLAPDSPLFDARDVDATTRLGLYVRDRWTEALYKSLGRQHELVFVTVGQWIVRQADGELKVMTDDELRVFYEVPDEPPVPPVEGEST